MYVQNSSKLVIAWEFLLLIPLALYKYIIAAIWYLTPRRFTPRKDISGQIILVTGAGSGIGRQIAVQFSEHAVTLVLMDINRTSLLDTEKMMNPKSKAFIYECDVSDRKQVYKVSEEIKKVVGDVDILVNNAGIVAGKRFMDLSDEMIIKTMEVNTLAHFWTLKAFLPAMLEKNRGHVVAISSNAGLHGLPLLTDYCASKYGVVGLMESLRMELDGQKMEDIKTTTVCPSLTQTGLFDGCGKPLTVLMDPEFVATEVVAGVLANEEIILLPRWMFVFFILRWLMPESTTKIFNKKSGVIKFMDSFTGRQNEKIGNGTTACKETGVSRQFVKSHNQ